jgi:hypothetical protein
MVAAAAASNREGPDWRRGEDGRSACADQSHPAGIQAARTTIRQQEFFNAFTMRGNARSLTLARVPAASPQIYNGTGPTGKRKTNVGQKLMLISMITCSEKLLSA